MAQNFFCFPAQYAARAKRSEARAALLQIATMQERHYLANKTYTAGMSNLGFPVDDRIENFFAGEALEFKARGVHPSDVRYDGNVRFENAGLAVDPPDTAEFRNAEAVGGGHVRKCQARAGI